jgi:hypothetical protein
MSQLLSLEENRNRQKSLLDEVSDRGLTALLGIGQHSSNGWPGEESILVPGLQLEAARAIASTAHSQNNLRVPSPVIGECNP